MKTNKSSSEIIYNEYNEYFSFFKSFYFVLKKRKNMTLSLFSTPTKSVWMPVTDSISSSVPRRYFCLCLIGHSARIWPESHFWRLAMHPWNFPERNTLHSHSTLSVFAQDYVGRFPHLNDKFNKWNLNLYCH